MEHESNADTSCNWRARNDPKRLGMGARKVGTSREHPNCNVFKIDQNTKCPGDLKRLAVTRTPVKDPRTALKREAHDKYNK